MRSSGYNIKISHKTKTPTKPEEKTLMEWIGIKAIVDLVRLTSEKTWQPETIALSSAIHPNTPKPAWCERTTFITSSKNAFVLLPCRFLVKPINSISQDNSINPDFFLNLRTESDLDILRSLREVLQPYLSYKNPPIELAAEMAGVTKRTLQRKLKQFNITYSDLIEQIRIERAKRLLKDLDLSVKKIGSEVGYSDPSNFIRAFKRKCGLTPNQYRKFN